MRNPKWEICPVCEQRCQHGTTIHYACWKASFGWDSNELRYYVRKHNVLPPPKPIAKYLNDEALEWEEDNAGIDLDAPTDKGEQCVECGKDSMTCEHYREEDNQ